MIDPLRMAAIIALLGAIIGLVIAVSVEEWLAATLALTQIGVATILLTDLHRGVIADAT